MSNTTKVLLTAEDILFEYKPMRSADSKHFRMKDGSYIAVQYDAVVHHQDDNGEWADIDNRLAATESEDGGSFLTCADGSNNVRFAQRSGNGHLFQTGHDKHSLSVNLVDAASTEAVEKPTERASDNSLANATEPLNIRYELAYKDILDGVDIEYSLYGKNIKENIIIKKRRDSYALAFSFNLENLAPIENETGSISLTDPETGNVIYIMPAPYMCDAAGEFSEDVRYTLSKGEDGYELTVNASGEWINAEGREFPVTVDPPIIFQGSGTANQTLHIGHIDSASPSTLTTSNLYIGGVAAGNRYRIYMKPNGLNALIPQNSVLTAAFFSMFQYGTTSGYGQYGNMAEFPMSAHALNSNTWTFSTAYEPRAIDFAMAKSVSDYTSITWDLTSIAKQWHDNAGSNYGVVLKASNEDKMDGVNGARARFYATTAAYLPKLVVQYRSAVGLEDYYTYHTQDISRAGTGYVMDYTGFVTLVKEDVSNASTVLPYSLQHVYNSANNNQASADPDRYKNMFCGLGWKLNAQQTIAVYDSDYLVYLDGDGTKHWFAKQAQPANTYWDEDGLGLTAVTMSNGTYEVTDLKSNKMKFSSAGFLTNITDRNGNQINFTYSSSRLTKITSQNNGSNVTVTIAALVYDSNGYLESVTDRVGNKTTYTYSGNRLVTVTHADDTTAVYVYGGGNTDRLTNARDVESRRAISYSYFSNGTVMTIAESGNAVSGKSIIRLQPSISQTVYQYPQNDDIREILLFDRDGRTVNTHITDSSGQIIVGEMGDTQFLSAATLRQKNRVEEAVAKGVAAVNLLHDSSMEINSGWTASGTASRSSAKARTGTYSVRATATTSEATYTHSAVALIADKTYTLSAYVHAVGVTFGSGGGVFFRKGSNNGNMLREATVSSIEGGWRRITYTFKQTSNANYSPVIVFKDFTGTIYADDFQLEVAEGPSSYNMFYYGNMEKDGWSSGTPSHFQYSPGNGLGGSRALKLIGNPNGVVSAYTIIPVNLSSSHTFMLSGWAKGESVALSDPLRSFGLTATVYYDDGSPATVHKMDFDPDVTDWQFITFAITPTPDKTVIYIQVYITYDRNMNEAYFDNLSLLRELSEADLFSYDANIDDFLLKNGNVSKWDAAQLDPVNYTYDSKNVNMTKETGGAEGTFDYTYDSKNNLTQTKSGSAYMKTTYNSAGNATVSKLSNSSGSVTINNTAEYSSDGNRVTKETDPSGEAITYSYGNSNSVYEMTGIPNSVTTPDGTVVTNSYFAINGRWRQSYISSVVVADPVYQDGMVASIRAKGYYNDTANYSELSYYFTRDGFGNITKLEVGPYNSTSNRQTLASYEYFSNNGNLKKLTYGNSQYMEYTYDSLDRVKTVLYNSHSTSTPRLTYSYTGDGQLYSVKDAALNREAVYDYDGLGRLLHYLDTEITGGVIKTLMQVSREYDSKGRLSAVHYRPIAFDPRQIGYVYSDTDGTLTQMTTANGMIQKYTYDSLQRLTRRLSENSSGTALYNTNYTYRTPSSNDTESTATAQISAFKYRKSNHATTDWIEFTYTYDNMGNIKSFTDPMRDGTTTVYRYDKQGQVLYERHNDDGTWTEFTYDGVGNIRSKYYRKPTAPGAPNVISSGEYTYGSGKWADLLTSYKENGTTTYNITYDNVGNPLTYRHGMTFTWRNGRELATVKRGTATYTYTYNSDGLRSGKSIPGGSHTWQYSYLDGKLVSMMNTGSVEKSAFIYDESGRPHSWDYVNSTGQHTRYYYITNLQGDVVQIVDTSLNTVATYRYNAFGEIISSITSGSIAQINPLRYRGYFYDNETGLYYVGSRYYDPVTCRWINADGLVFSGGFDEGAGFLQYNLFAYCGNNPVMRVDPSGEAWWWAALSRARKKIIYKILRKPFQPPWPTAIAPGLTGRDAYISSRIIPKWTEGLTPSQSLRFSEEVYKLLNSTEPDYYPSWEEYAAIYVRATR